MKKFFLTITFLAFVTGLFAAVQINKLEPAFWWTGMKNPELQIMVYGSNIREAQVKSLSPNVTVKSVVKGDSPNYLFVYLDLSQAKAGKADLLFTQGKEKKKISYELKPRTVDPVSRKGFTSYDVLYLLMPDRFANGNPDNDNLKMKSATVNVNRNDPNARHGGDLAGIEQHLDYLADLGVTALWFTPVLANDMPGGSYHGYAITDYYNIDPRFGKNEDYVRLVNETHHKGMKMVMDMVFNHCGSEHIWRKDPPFKDWFNLQDKYMQTNHAKGVSYDPYASEYDKKQMYNGWFDKMMPDLNQRNPQLARYLIQNSIWWVEYAGIDGIRQDTYPYSDATMMSQWCKEVFTEYPNLNIVGEAWYDNVGGTAFWQADGPLNKKGNSHLKTVMDFPFTIASHDAFHQETDWGNGLTKIYDLLSLDYLYADVNNLLVFLENHDTDRFLREMPQDLSAFKQAYTYILTTRGIPQLYYGTEILMNGIKKEGDGFVRREIPGGWPGDVVNSFTPEGRTALQNEAYNFAKKLLNWRKNSDIIAKGTLRHFAPRNGAYVYLREYQGKKVLVMLNGKNSQNTVCLDSYAELLNGVSSGKDVITGRTVNLDKELTLAPRESLILEL